VELEELLKGADGGLGVFEVKGLVVGWGIVPPVFGIGFGELLGNGLLVVG